MGYGNDKNTTILAGDVEIGAVEIKNDSDDTRAKVGAGTAANGLRTVTASDSPDVATLGATTGAAVITDANGTIQQYLRGLVKRWVDALGAGTAAAALRVTTASDDPLGALSGAVNETAPATDTASSGLNGRLQRVAQRITSLIALLPTALGAGGGLKIDGSGTAVPVSGTVAVTNTPLTNIGAGEYETVAASQTAQALGATGATGDYISGILVIPATTSPGQVLLLDNAISITVFVGGASSVSNLVPFFIPLGMISVSGAFKITTGASVSAIGIGNFS